VARAATSNAVIVVMSGGKVALSGNLDGRSLERAVSGDLSIGGNDWCIQFTICSTASGSSSVRSITPVSDSRNGVRHAPSKNEDLEQTSARWTEYLLKPQTSVRSEYLPHSNNLGQLSRELVNESFEHTMRARTSIQR